MVHLCRHSLGRHLAHLSHLLHRCYLIHLDTSALSATNSFSHTALYLCGHCAVCNCSPPVGVIQPATATMRLAIAHICISFIIAQEISFKSQDTQCSMHVIYLLSCFRCNLNIHLSLLQTSYIAIFDSTDISSLVLVWRLSSFKLYTAAGATPCNFPRLLSSQSFLEYSVFKIPP